MTTGYTFAEVERTVACPYCKAAVGEKCLRTRYQHRSRMLRFLEGVHAAPVTKGAAMTTPRSKERGRRMSKNRPGPQKDARMLTDEEIRGFTRPSGTDLTAREMAIGRIVARAQLLKVDALEDAEGETP